MSDVAVLLMAYGTPGSLDEVADYYTSIRGGRRPPEAAIAELRARYARVGGHTPLLAITGRLAARVQEQLGPGYRVYVGMKHWHPFIAEAVRSIGQRGDSRLVAIPLAPHYSTVGTEGYRAAVREALAAERADVELTFVPRWHDHPGFRALIAARIHKALDEFAPEARAGVRLLFSAHSLPRSILERGDPYPEELRTSAAAIAALVGERAWDFAYQSAGRSQEPWLGPDILETLRRLAGAGFRHILSVPFGFVCDHLEILYDIDVEARGVADQLQVELRRIAMPNADPEFAALLADLVRQQAAAPGPPAGGPVSG